MARRSFAVIVLDQSLTKIPNANCRFLRVSRQKQELGRNYDFTTYFEARGG
jgi:hypothetical protein